MQKHEIECQHCGAKFESTRSNTMYCSNSCKTRASQIRTKGDPEIKIKFEQHEFDELSEIANDFELSVEELVKFRSLSMGKKKVEDDVIKAMELDNKKLRAELSLYTKSPSEGYILDVSEAEKVEMRDAINNSRVLSKLDSDITKKIQSAVYYCKELEDMNPGLFKKR